MMEEPIHQILHDKISIWDDEPKTEERHYDKIPKTRLTKPKRDEDKVRAKRKAAKTARKKTRK